MPISGCHDLPLATFNLPSRNNLQNKPNSAATMSLPCSRFATAQPQRRWDAPPGKQHRHSGIFRVAELGPGTMPRGKYPESPAQAGSHALISRTPTPGGMLHANLGLPRPPPRNFQPPLPRFPSRLSPRRMSGMTTGGFFHMLGAWERHRGGGALLPFVLRACCGSMCWPVDRPATHAAAGAAARGKSKPLVLPVHRRYAVCGRSGVQRLLAESGPDERNSGRFKRGLIRCAGRALERPFGAVTPLERRDEY